MIYSLKINQQNDIQFVSGTIPELVDKFTPVLQEGSKWNTGINTNPGSLEKLINALKQSYLEIEPNLKKQPKIECIDEDYEEPAKYIAPSRRKEIIKNTRINLEYEAKNIEIKTKHYPIKPSQYLTEKFINKEIGDIIIKLLENISDNKTYIAVSNKILDKPRRIENIVYYVNRMLGKKTIKCKIVRDHNQEYKEARLFLVS